MKYLATTKPIPVKEPVIMVDGTVPGWQLKATDQHFDHHRPGGAKVQLIEIPATVAQQLTGNEIFVTTQVDADACVAAAWCQLGDKIDYTVKRKLEAIAWDCDHLMVPPHLEDLAEFATQAVAALKIESDKIPEKLGLPLQRSQWSEEHRRTYASEAFRQGSEWLIDASLGKRLFPGEAGEAANYWQQVEANRDLLVEQKCISYISTSIGLFPVCDTRRLNRYIDPRSFLQALTDINRLLPVTLSARNFKTGTGTTYTLGCIPTHPRVNQFDYTESVFKKLTEAEKAKNPNTEGWGGRATVGGSGWNTFSSLTPEEVVEIVCDCLKAQFVKQG